MEEIDIIELLKRVKEGKAPKEIEIKGKKYNFIKDSLDICFTYKDSEKLSYLISEHICFDTKIKILDKPIIEEIENDLGSETANSLRDKINEIIRYLDKEEK